MYTYKYENHFLDFVDTEGIMPNARGRSVGSLSLTGNLQ